MVVRPGCSGSATSTACSSRCRTRRPSASLRRPVQPDGLGRRQRQRARREPDGGWYADNFDGSGFVAGLCNAGHDPAGARSPSSARAARAAPSRRRCWPPGSRRCRSATRTPRGCRRLAGRLTGRWPGRTSPRLDPPGPAARHRGERDPARAARRRSAALRRRTGLPPDAVVADIIMQPRETPLLRDAAGLRLTVHHGHHMLDCQVASYRAFFHLG